MEPITPILAITGHRTLSHPEEDLRLAIRNELRRLKPTKVLNGMALGFDMLVAEECLKLNIPFIACVPFEGQEKFWLPGQRLRYGKLLESAEKTEILYQDGFASWKYLKRNEHMVKHATHLLAYWDGSFKSGTGHTVNQATKKDIPIINLFGVKKPPPSSDDVSRADD